MKKAQSQIVFLSKSEMRNLKAKIKQLIPEQNCKCTEHRNDRMHQLACKLRIWRAKHDRKQKRWGEPTPSELKYFTEGLCYEKKKKPSFNKLSTEEIEQVCQFKHYYLGQKNIPLFNEFIDERNRHSLLLNLKTKTSSPEEGRKHTSHHGSSSRLKHPSNYRLSHHKQYLNKEYQRREQAKSNHESIMYKQQRKCRQLMQKQDAKITVANRMKQEYINKYLKQLQDNDSRYLLQRTKIFQKKRLEAENNQILDLATKLKRVCSFRPNRRKAN